MMRGMNKQEVSDMEIKVKDVKAEVNRPEIRFDAYKLEQAEIEKLEKQKRAIIAASVITGVAIVASNLWKLKKKFKK